jgi:aminopeptidase N
LPGENLTRTEAQERASLVRTRSYDVSLDLTTGPETFRSTTTVRFSATEGASTFIDAITRTVHSVTLNGVELDPAAVSDGVRIQLDGLKDENELTVVADAIYTNTGEGLHRFVDPVDGEILAIDGVERTETSLSMGELIPFRIGPLLAKKR